MAQRIILIFGIAVLIYLGFGLLFFIFQRSYIYFPTKQDFYECPEFANAQKIDWSGTRMYVKRTSDRWAVVYHGNAGSACDRGYFKSILEEQDYSYAFVEYAGYSNDGVAPNQERLMKNAEAAADYMRRLNPSSVAIIGESLGAALASYHASVAEADKILLIAAFNNLADTASRRYRLYPVKLLLRDVFPADEWIKDANSILFIHGNRDEIIPIDLARRLYDAARTADKRFIEIDGAGHNDIYKFSETNKAIRDYLK